MEVFAGFVEHTDAQVGRLISGIESLGLRDNTIIFYVFGDNGSSAEGQNGSISELLAQNQIPSTIQQQLTALDKIGGLDTLGSNKVENMYHAGWAWAGDTPFRYTKLVASHFGGTRNPLVISWPKGIKPDGTPRPQFHHVNDVAPTIYDILGITPPKVVNGIAQDPIDGVSMVYTFSDQKAPWRKSTQYFENNGSRGIYHDGWYAAAFGPLIPWLTVSPGLDTWDANKDVWELYDLRHDFSQANDLAAEEPGRLAEMKQLFLGEAAANKVFPVGAGLWTRLHPEDRVKVPYRHWAFDATTTRLPEFAAPGLGRESNHVVVDANVRPERLRRALRAWRHRRRPDAVSRQRPSGLRVQHDDDRAHHRAFGRCRCRRAGTRSPSTQQSPSLRVRPLLASRVDGKAAYAYRREADGRRRLFGERDARCRPGSRLARYRSTISITHHFPFDGTIEKVEVELQ